MRKACFEVAFWLYSLVLVLIAIVTILWLLLNDSDLYLAALCFSGSLISMAPSECADTTFDAVGLLVLGFGVLVWLALALLGLRLRKRMVGKSEPGQIRKVVGILFVLMVVGITALCIVGVLVQSGYDWREDPGLGPEGTAICLGTLVISTIVIVLSLLYHERGWRCPHCGKWGTGTKISSVPTVYMFLGKKGLVTFQCKNCQGQWEQEWPKY